MRPKNTNKCSIAGCGRAYYARTWCKKHYVRWSKSGDPNTTLPRRGVGRQGLIGVHWNRDIVGYRAVHHRLDVEIGPAKTLMCVDCNGFAQEWSLDFESDSDIIDERGRPYNLDLTHYAPRCCHDHRLHDASQQRFAP